MSTILIDNIKTFTSTYQGKDQEKYFIEFDHGKAGYAFKGKWNAGWKAGDEVECDVIKLDKPDKKGNTVYSLKCPENLRPQQRSGGSSLNTDELAQTLRYIKKDILEEIAAAKAEIMKVQESQLREINRLIAHLKGEPVSKEESREISARDAFQKSFDERNPPLPEDDDCPF